MIRKLAKIFGVFILLCSLFTSCGIFDGEEDKSIPKENMIVFTAQYGEDPVGERIVVADFYNPSNYWFITDTSKVNRFPFISPNKEKIIFHSETGESNIFQLSYYSFETDEITIILGRIGLGFESLVWKKNSQSFYSSTSEFDLINITNNNKITDDQKIIGLISSDTLVVFKSDISHNGEFAQGHIEYITNGGLQIKSFQQLPYFFNNWFEEASKFDWNKDLKLIVSTVKGTNAGPGMNWPRLAIFSPDGEQISEFVGDYSISKPCWAPDDLILIEKKDPETHYPNEKYTLLVYNYRTGEMYDWANPAIFDGAVSLRYPDW